MQDDAKPGTRKYCERSWEQLVRERQSWMADYMELSRYISPRRGKFALVDPKNPNQRTTDIIDATARMSLRTLVSGMVAGNTSPSRPWAKLGVDDYDLQGFGAVKTWLSDSQRALFDVLRKTNFYGAMPKIYEEEGLFGTGCGMVLDDPDSFLRFYTFTAGSYCLGVDHRGIVDTMYRELSMTPLNMAKQFGKDALSNTVKKLLESNPRCYIPVRYAVEPRMERVYGKLDSKNMPYSSIWYEVGADNDQILSESGFKTFPVLAPRWDLNEGDAYGSGPGIDILGDNKQLQFEQKQKTLNIEKIGNPPLSAPTSLRQRPIGQMPGDITFHDSTAGSQKIERMVDIHPQAIREIREDITEIQSRIKKGFYVDTFLMLAQRESATPPTAREVDELHQEKMIELGPVVERQEHDLQSPVIQIVFQKMLAQSKPIWDGMAPGKPLLPKPPRELLNAEIKVEFISALAQAQKSIGMSAIERVMVFAGNYTQQTQDQSMLDGIDPDAALQEFAEMAGPPPRVIRSPEKIETIRESRQQQQDMASAVQGTETMSKAVKNVGSVKTDENNPIAKLLGGGKGT